MTKMFETVEIDLSDEEFLIIAKRAHEKDITFNQMVAEILWEQVKKHDIQQSTGTETTGS